MIKKFLNMCIWKNFFCTISSYAYKKLNFQKMKNGVRWHKTEYKNGINYFFN